MAANDGRHPVTSFADIPLPQTTGAGTGSPGAADGAWESTGFNASLGVQGIAADPYASGQDPRLATAEVVAGATNLPGQSPDRMPFAGSPLGGETAGQAASGPYGSAHVVPMPSEGHPNG